MLTPAKVNLYLHVTGKRPDGYHLLNTLIAFTNIYDEVIITPASNTSLEITGEFAHLVENNEDNIVLRAYRLMAKECGKNENVAIHLVKNIPVGAGLGGGSSDASATIILLNEMWKTGFSQEKLAEIGLKLGADVPIFINRHAAFVSGIGDKISNTKNLPELYAILVYPNKFIATKDIFQVLTLGKKWKLLIQKIKYFIGFSFAYTGIIPWLSFIQNQRNDLENTAISARAEIAALLEELSSLTGCAFARMSGSGSACFAIFTDKNKAESALLQIKHKNPSFWVKMTKIIQKY